MEGEVFTYQCRSSACEREGEERAPAEKNEELSVR